MIKIKKLLEDSGVFIDGVTETVEHEVKKKQEDGFLRALLAPSSASLVQPVISSVVKGIIGRGVRRAGKRFMDKMFLFPLHPVSRLLIISIMNPDLMAFFQKNLLRKKDTM